MKTIRGILVRILMSLFILISIPITIILAIFIMIFGVIYSLLTWIIKGSTIDYADYWTKLLRDAIMTMFKKSIKYRKKIR